MTRNGPCKWTACAVYFVVPAEKQTYLNAGIYSVTEAARLTGVSRGRIRRWMHGFPAIMKKAEKAKPGSCFIVCVNASCKELPWLR